MEAIQELRETHDEHNHKGDHNHSNSGAKLKGDKIGLMESQENLHAHKGHSH